MKKLNGISPKLTTKKKPINPLPTIKEEDKENIKKIPTHTKTHPSKSRAPFTPLSNHTPNSIKPQTLHSHQPRKRFKTSRLSKPTTSNPLFKPRIHQFSHSKLPSRKRTPHFIKPLPSAFPSSFPPSQSHDHLVENIIKIQSVVRGFIARNKFKSIRDNFFIHIIKFKSEKLLNALKSIENRLNINSSTGFITTKDFNNHVKKLISVTDKFKLFLPDINNLGKPH